VEERKEKGKGQQLAWNCRSLTDYSRRQLCVTKQKV